jgi:hypothetical protein
MISKIYTYEAICSKCKQSIQFTSYDSGGDPHYQHSPLPNGWRKEVVNTQDDSSYRTYTDIYHYCPGCAGVAS